MFFQKDAESENKELFKAIVKMFLEEARNFGLMLLTIGPWALAVICWPFTLFISSGKFGDGPIQMEEGFINSLLIRPINAVLNAYYFPTSLEGWVFTWGVLGLCYAVWAITFWWGALCALLGVECGTGGKGRKGRGNSGAGVYAHVGTRGVSVTAGTRFAGGWLSVGKRGVSWRKSKKLF
ncbi:TPA: hypothetical protein IGZ64_004108 [Escherichia coli]|nr:hypothetical protein [Escherichia coli]